MEIRLADERDLDEWMRLVRKERESFPGLETEAALTEHRETVRDFMRRESAICAACGGRIVGELLFSKEESMLCYLAVDSEYRRRHVAKDLVSHMLTLMDPNRAIVVTTYREGVPEGIAARAFYKHLGFAKGRLTEEFGSPVQEFVWIR